MAMNSHIRRCSRCIIPETVPGITFDEAGVCSLCCAYVAPHKSREEMELRGLIEESRIPTNQYDCVVPLSGGRDSSFVLYMAVKRYGLRVLAVNYDNEFQTDQTPVNIENACRCLGVELLRVRSRWNIASKITRASVRGALPYGLGAITDDMCAACAFGYISAAYRAAEHYRTPLILWGHASVEHTDRMLKTLAVKHRRLTRREKLLNFEYYKAQAYGLLQRCEFPVPGNRVLSRKRVRLKNETIREIRLFDYLSWDREEIKRTIIGELGWQKPAGYVSTWRTDCKLHELMNYCWLREFGCTKDCFGHCNMINAGQMSRSEALEQEEQMAVACERGAQQVLREDLNLTEAELAPIMSRAEPATD